MSVDHVDTCMLYTISVDVYDDAGIIIMMIEVIVTIVLIIIITITVIIIIILIQHHEHAKCQTGKYVVCMTSCCQTEDCMQCMLHVVADVLRLKL